jgi:hypothetical protein
MPESVLARRVEKAVMVHDGLAEACDMLLFLSSCYSFFHLIYLILFRT